GICGGYQMLGRRVADPDGIEGPPGEAVGLGLLDIDTELTGDKLLRPVSGRFADGAAFHGYEMHVGRTIGHGPVRPCVELTGAGPDGAVSADGRIAGCYVHGLFAQVSARASLLGGLGAAASGGDYGAVVDQALDEIAAELEMACDVMVLSRLAGLETRI
ncbi:MAG: cobyric acid synthase CobQ, partial [Dehalococcoidia bacterium]|nr:cobyric acid synthase CobQ [Dehalococcoidia bacterium]